MAEFIESINYTVWSQLTTEEKKRLKCAEITFNGEYLFTYANGNIEPSGYLRTRVEYDCQAANAVGGETLEQILESRKKEKVGIK